MTTAAFVGDGDPQAWASQLAREHKQLKARLYSQLGSFGPITDCKAREQRMIAFSPWRLDVGLDQTKFSPFN